MGNSNASLIVPNLYLGPAAAWKQVPELKYVINLSGTDLVLPPDVQQTRIIIEDNPKSNIAQYFPQTNPIIANALATKQTIYVCCDRGVSRSPTIVLAYFMSIYGWSFEYARSWLRQFRSVINPNEGFAGLSFSSFCQFLLLLICFFVCFLLVRIRRSTTRNSICCSIPVCLAHVGARCWQCLTKE